MKTKKTDWKKYGEVHIKKYERALDDIELLKGQVRALNARLNTLLTVTNKIDARGKVKIPQDRQSRLRFMTLGPLQEETTKWWIW